MKICAINALEFVTFDFFKKYFLNLGFLKSALGALVNKTLKIFIRNFLGYYVIGTKFSLPFRND